MLRISARAFRTTSAEHHGQTSGGAGSSGIRSTSQASPLDRDMLNTIADRVHFHRRKNVLPGFTMASRHHGQVFVIFIEPAGGDRFPSRPGRKRRVWRVSNVLTGGGQRRTDTPRIFCHLVTDASYRIVHRIKNSPDFVFGQPFSGIRERLPAFRLPEVPAATAPLSCRTVPVPPRFRSVSEWRRPGAAAVRRRDG